MPFTNEHSARLFSPTRSKIRVRRTKGSGKLKIQGTKIPTSISVIWYVVRTTEGKEAPLAQSLRFPISTWGEKPSKAKNWLKNHKIKYTLFEAAKIEKAKTSLNGKDGKMTVKKTEEIPASALYFKEGGTIKTFKAAEDAEKKNGTFQMVANSGKIIKKHWLWGNLGIDMTGVKFKSNKIAVLHEHNTGEKVGWTDDIKAEEKNGILVQGTYSSVSEISHEVQDMAEDGFPYQASVRLRPERIERIPDGEEAEVNGHTLSGPGTIFRTSTLREVSFCALGADENTMAASSSDEPEKIEMEIECFNEQFEKGNEMEMKDLTLADLKEQRPELVAEILKDQKPDNSEEIQKAKDEALKAERDRTAAIFKNSEEFKDQEGILDVMREGIEKGTPAEGILSVMKDKKIKNLESNTTPSPGANDEPDNSTDLTGLKGEELYKAEWKKDAKLRDEFSDNYEEYAAFRDADDRGLVKIKQS